MIRVPLRFGLEGIVTVECLVAGKIVHTQRMKNIITDQGLTALRTGASELEAVSTVCVLGRKAHESAPAAGDTMLSVVAGLWAPEGCANNAFMAFASGSPPQPRAVVAVSEDNGATEDAYTFHDGEAPYWSLTRTRVFSKNTTCFPAAAAIPDTDGPTASDAAWFEDGWFNLSVEASYIDEIAFCSSLHVDTFDVVLPLCSGPGNLDFSFPLWVGLLLWNRVALAQSIGFDLDPEEVNVFFPWQGHAADILLPPESGQIRVTYELRVYPDIAPVVQSLTIEGVPTVVTTKLVDFDNPDIWGEDGFLGHFGYWKTDEYAARLVETGSYGATIKDPFTYGSSENVDSAVKQNPGGFAQTQRYKAGAAKGNFDEGIGFLAHGNFGGAAIGHRHAYVTQFNPPVSKLDSDRIQLDVKYTWSRR